MLTGDPYLVSFPVTDTDSHTVVWHCYVVKSCASSFVAEQQARDRASSPAEVAARHGLALPARCEVRQAIDRLGGPVF